MFEKKSSMSIIEYTEEVEKRWNEDPVIIKSAVDKIILPSCDSEMVVSVRAQFQAKGDSPTTRPPLWPSQSLHPSLSDSFISISSGIGLDSTPGVRA